jgi:hypothetical protein
MPSIQRSTQNGPDRRPKALKYAEKVNAAEKMMVDALPEIIAKLVSMAKEGDIAAARYVVDRIYGRVSRVPVPPAADKSLPYTHDDWSEDTLLQKERRDDFHYRHITAKYGTDRAATPGAESRAPLPGIAAPRSSDPLMEALRKELESRGISPPGR